AGPGRPLPPSYPAWAAACRAADGAAAGLAAVLGPEREECADRLRAFARRTDVADALLQLSPDFHDAVTHRSPPRGTAGGRALERRLYAYAQRLAAKNETTSAFGPVTFGRFAPGAADHCGPEAPDGVYERRSFVSFWAAAEIGRAATRAARVREGLPVRRLPVLRTADGAALLPGRPPHPLTGTEERVLAACDGRLTAAGIAAATGIRPDEVRAAVRALEARAFVGRRCEPSSTVFDPLGDVLRQLPDVPELDGFRREVRRFADAVEEFTRLAPAGRPSALVRIEALFTGLTGRPARRNAGATYADRSVLFEDCAGDAQPVVLTEERRAALTAHLAPVLNFGLAVGQAVRRSYRALAAELLEKSGPVPYLEFAERLAEFVRDGGLRARQGEVAALREGYERLVRAASDGRVARLDARALAGLARPGPGAAFVSPDVMLAGDGSTPVLGEIHPYVFGWGLQGAFAPDPAALDDELRALLPVWGGPGRLATVLHRRRHKGLLSERFPGTFVEVTGVAAGSTGGARRRPAAVADLWAELRDGEPELLGPDGPLTLYVGEEDHPHLRVFAPAQVELPRLDFGVRTPRIEIGPVVAQRAAWNPGPGRTALLTTAPGPGLWTAVHALRTELGVPRHVFAASPAEIKPVCLDLDAPFALEQLRALVRAGPVRLVEMLPGPEELWLRRSTGPHTSELRLTMVRSAAEET
ncbi:lantibiotic dehydratase, partial [Streptomyces sp. I05A-00742]|uniref:lantibiotic dehydratase n=1 Tax=Streptomyces sp. I05A-00742 TaxID=2732853 RepID=UPI0014876AAF